MLTVDQARCACCSWWYLYQNCQWVAQSTKAYACGICSKFVCDGCRSLLARISPNQFLLSSDNNWGVCCGKDASDSRQRHAFIPNDSPAMAAIIIGLWRSDRLYCVACLDDAHQRQSEGEMNANLRVPSGLTYAQWLAHQYECCHVVWMCPARCGYFGTSNKVRRHAEVMACSLIPLTKIPARGSTRGEIRMLPHASTPWRGHVPAALIKLDQCSAARMAMPMIVIENRNHGLFLVVATCVPPTKALVVTALVTSWTRRPAFYRSDEVTQYGSASEALRRHQSGRAGAHVVQAHRIAVDGYGTQDYCMGAETTDIESGSASLPPALMAMGFRHAKARGMDRPVRSNLVQGVIPMNSQVSTYLL